MKQLVFHAPGDLRWESAPEPTLPDARAVLVRPLAVAACDLDVALTVGRVPLPGPLPLGHEFVAEVVEVGADVQSLRAGQIVGIPFQITCGQCERCRAGLTGNCTTVPARASYGLGLLGGLEWGGALTDLVVVPFADWMAVALPDSIDPPALASISDNLPDAYRAVAAVTSGTSVLIVGGGSIGLYAAGMASVLGGEVTYVDTAPERLAIAEKLGVSVLDRPLDRPMGRHPLVVHTSADPGQLREAIRSTDHGGECVDTGIYFGGEAAMPLLEMYGTGMTFRTGRAHARRDIPKVLQLITQRGYDPGLVTSRTVPWWEAAGAFGSSTTKLVVTR